MGESIVWGVDRFTCVTLGRSDGGKLTDSQDSFRFSYIVIDPREENFSISATFEVEDASGAGFQTGYGIAAVDTVVSPKSACRHRNHLLLGRFRAADGRNFAYGLRIVGGYTNRRAMPQDGRRKLDPSRLFPTQDDVDEIRAGDRRRFTLEKTDEGFKATMETPEGPETIIFPGHDFLLRQDRKAIYVGIAVAGEIKLRIGDVRFEKGPGLLSRVPDGAIRHYVPDYPFSRGLIDNLPAYSEGDPFDLAGAVSRAVPGSEIILPDGVYEGGPYYIDKSGEAGKPIILKAEHPGNAIIDGSSNDLKLPALTLRGNHWILDGLVFRDAPSSGLFICGSDNIIRNCEAYRNGDTGILICSFPGGPKDEWPARNKVESCVSRDNRDKVCRNADGFGAKLSIGKGNGFYSCKAFGNADDGFDLYTKSTLGPVGPVTLEDCEAYSNVIGFKLGGEGQRVRHRLGNCFAHDNSLAGFDSNSNPSCRLRKCVARGNGQDFK